MGSSLICGSDMKGYLAGLSPEWHNARVTGVRIEFYRGTHSWCRRIACKQENPTPLETRGVRSEMLCMSRKGHTRGRNTAGS